MTPPIAREVIRDLIKGDAAIDEVSVLQELVLTTNQKVLDQTDLITTLKAQTLSLESMVKQKDQQLEAQRKISEEFEKAFKKERRTKNLYKVGATLGAAATVLYLIK